MDTSKMNSCVTNINNLGFDSIWSGSAYEAQSQQLTDTMNKLNQCISDLNDFDVILTKRDEYIQICTTLSDLYSQRAGCQSGHGEEEEKNGCGNCSYLNGQINTYEKKRQDLRTEIIGLLAQFVGIDAEILPPMDLSNIDDGNIDYFVDVDKILAIYSRPGGLAHLSGSPSLFDLYNEYDANGNVIPYSGEKYVNEQIALVVSQCSSEREIAVNVSLKLLELAGDKGYCLTYENPGAQGGIDGWINSIDGTNQYTYHPEDDNGYDPSIVYNKDYNNITQMEEGMDCCAIVSYLLNVATADDPTAPNPTGFAWQGVDGLNNYGEPVPTSEVKPGDIFIAPSCDANGNIVNEYGHTGMVVAIYEDPNNPGHGTVIVAESGGTKTCYSLNQYTYSPDGNGQYKMHRASTEFRSMDSVYSGEQQSKR